MPTEAERIAYLESESKTNSRNIHELWNNINSLTAFKNQLEGSVKSIKWLLMFVGLSNIITILKLFAFSK